MKKLLLALLLCCVPAFAQFVPQPVAGYVNSGSGWSLLTTSDAGGVAGFTPKAVGIYAYNPTTQLYVPWAGSTATGTVTNFSAGNLTPLFSTSVSFSNTTPILSFLLSNAPGKSILGNTSATSGQPAYTTDPQVLTLTANSITSATVTATLLGNANTATTSTNLAGGVALGDVPYQSAVGTTAMLAGRTAATLGILCQTGNGTISAAPAWCSTVGTGSVVLSISPTGTGMITWARMSLNQATGTAPMIITSTTPVLNLTAANHPLMAYCGNSGTCTNTAQVNDRVITGIAVLNGAPFAVSGITAFADVNYTCTVTSRVGALTLETYATGNYTTTGFTIYASPVTSTATVGYICTH